MSPDQFVQSRQAAWQELAGLLDQSEQSLSTNQVAQIGRLYRAASSDLALAQRDFPYHDVTSYLNQLVARGHATVYRAKPFSGQQVRRFFTHGMPQTYRDSFRFILIASLLLYLPAIISGFAVAFNPDDARLYLNPQMQPIIEEIEANEPWFYFSGEEQPAASAMITTNNIRVSILAFAGGMTAGVFTLLVLIQNGLMLGSIVGLAVVHDFNDLLNFIIGHGVIELSMIGVAGGAGLVLAWAMLYPGNRTRRDAIYAAGQQALTLMIICGLWLIVAGLIEGFVSPQEFLNPAIKWAVGIGSGVIMYAYFLFAGREA